MFLLIWWGVVLVLFLMAVRAVWLGIKWLFGLIWPPEPAPSERLRPEFDPPLR
jgi:hypothetical protein